MITANKSSNTIFLNWSISSLADFSFPELLLPCNQKDITILWCSPSTEFPYRFAYQCTIMNTNEKRELLCSVYHHSNSPPRKLSFSSIRDPNHLRIFPLKSAGYIVLSLNSAPFVSSLSHKHTHRISASICGRILEFGFGFSQEIVGWGGTDWQM
jgi:hypothetical protein